MTFGLGLDQEPLGDGVMSDQNEIDRRVTVMETQFQNVRSNLDDLKTGQDKVLRELKDVQQQVLGELRFVQQQMSGELKNVQQQVSSELREIKTAEARNTAQLDELKLTLPTKDDLSRDLWSWKIQLILISLAVSGLIVAGIIGGLDWIKNH
jgi:chromosome segregation ATPase